MKKKLTAFILAAALAMSLPMAASATELTADSESIGTVIEEGSDSGVSVMSVASSDIGANRSSNTSGTVTAYALFSTTTSKAVCQIYLQEKYNGTWRSATGLSTTSYSKTVYNTNSIAAAKKFTLISGKAYRAKIVFIHTVNGTTYTKTRYTGAF